MRWPTLSLEATVWVSGSSGQPIGSFWHSDEKLFLKHYVPQHRKDRNLSRKCTTSLIRRQNHNGEVVDRSWLCFSPSQTCVKCLTCRLMCADTTKCAHFLIRKGIFDWKHALERLRSNEHSVEHTDATITFSRRLITTKNWYRTSQSVQSIRTILEIASTCNVWFLS